jgi:hypothetical protein
VAPTLSLFSAVEANAKRILDEAKQENISADFSEVHFMRDGTSGAIKAGNVIVNIDVSLYPAMRGRAKCQQKETQ